MRCVESRLSWGTRTTTTRGTVSPNTKALAIVGLDLCSEFGPFSGDSNSSYSSFHIASNVLRFTRFVECAEKLFPYLCSSSRPRLLLHKTAVCFPFPPERYVSPMVSASLSPFLSQACIVCIRHVLSTVNCVVGPSDLPKIGGGRGFRPGCCPNVPSLGYQPFV